MPWLLSRRKGGRFADFSARYSSRGRTADSPPEDNEHWLERAAPIVQAFLQSRFFVEMAVKHAALAEPPHPMPSGRAALLCLYGLR
jgi:hypothetical protein